MRVLRGLIGVGVLVIALAQLAGLAQGLHPALDSVAHFRLILTVLLIPAIGLALLIRRRVLASVTLMSLLAGLVGMTSTLGTNAITGEPDLTVLQFNAYARNATPLAIVSQVKEARPDVITLQEMWRPILVIMDELKADYPYQNLCRSGWVGGTAILSRWPVTDQGCATGLAWMRIEKDVRKMSVASLHLTWPWPMPQAKQIAELDPVLRAMPRPAVLAGDFNAAPWSTAAAPSPQRWARRSRRASGSPGCRGRQAGPPSRSCRSTRSSCRRVRQPRCACSRAPDRTTCRFLRGSSCRRPE